MDTSTTVMMIAAVVTLFSVEVVCVGQYGGTICREFFLSLPSRLVM